jgi:hypothetical protein
VGWFAKNQKFRFRKIRYADPRNYFSVGQVEKPQAPAVNWPVSRPEFQFTGPAMAGEPATGLIRAAGCSTLSFVLIQSRPDPSSTIFRVSSLRIVPGSIPQFQFRGLID